jgi:hypothetical protein
MQINRANGGKPKMREYRLRSVICHGALKQRCVKYTGLKQGLVYMEKLLFRGTYKTHKCSLWA